MCVVCGAPYLRGASLILLCLGRWTPLFCPGEARCGLPEFTDMKISRSSGMGEHASCCWTSCCIAPRVSAPRLFNWRPFCALPVARLLWLAAAATAIEALVR